MDHNSDTSTVNHVPRLIALRREIYDDDGNEIGARTIAWALSLPTGWTVTLPADSQPSVSVWRSLSEATAALDTFTDWPSPHEVPAEGLPAPSARLACA